MILRRTIIEFTDDPNDVRNFGCGDYYLDKNGNKVIRAYCQEDSTKWILWSFMCAMHELTEFELCDLHGIKEEDVDNFDRIFNEQNFNGEPGDHPCCIYREEHHFAEKIEKMLCNVFGFRWKDYFKNYVIPKNFKYNEDYGKDNL